MIFPELQARSLQGVDKRLPADLPARRTLLLLPFHQWQQRQVDAWIALAEAADLAADLSVAGRSELPATAVIEVPCISRRWGVARRFIDGGMTAGIGVPVVLARTWTAYTDVAHVQRALHIPNSEQTWVGVIDRGGEVLAQASGDPSQDAWSGLAAAMTA